MSVRVDRRSIPQLNAPGEFRGTSNNSENIGKPSLEIAEKWNSGNPGSQVDDLAPPA